MIFLAGQGGFDKTGTLGESFDAQAKQVFENIRLALKHVDASVTDIVRLTVFIVDYSPEKMSAYHTAQAAALGDHHPAATLIPVPALAAPDMLIEIEATAAV